MIRYIKSYFWEYEFNSLTPHSMAPIPKNKFINFAREKAIDDSSEETHKNIYEFRAWERKIKIQNQIHDLEDLVDQLNH